MINPGRGFRRLGNGNRYSTRRRGVVPRRTCDGATGESIELTEREVTEAKPRPSTLVSDQVDAPSDTYEAERILSFPGVRRVVAPSENSLIEVYGVGDPIRQGHAPRTAYRVSWCRYGRRRVSHGVGWKDRRDRSEWTRRWWLPRKRLEARGGGARRRSSRGHERGRGEHRSLGSDTATDTATATAKRRKSISPLSLRDLAFFSPGPQYPLIPRNLSVAAVGQDRAHTRNNGCMTSRSSVSHRLCPAGFTVTLQRCKDGSRFAPACILLNISV
jgi:hypothetical protein